MLAWPSHHAKKKIQNNWKLLITFKLLLGQRGNKMKITN